jgi:hypothetical protein
MASIRLFGRGKSAAAAASGPAVGAAQIADVLDGLTAASMSTTWHCRHGSGVSIGEGAVDFAAGRSRSTVIRGKYTFEYVRSGSSAYRTAVTDVDAGVSANAGARAAVNADVDVDDEDDDVEVIAEEEESEAAELEAFDDEEDGEAGEGGDEVSDADDPIDDEIEAEDGEDEGGEEEEDEDGALENDEDELSVPVTASASVSAGSSSAWEKFSEHDACGVHAYAEPAVLAAGVLAAGVVQPRETQEIDGVKLSAYSVTLKPKPADPNRLLARLARQLRDHGANTVVVTAFVDESQSGVEELDETGAENGDGSPSSGEGGAPIVRIRIELPHWTPADDPTADHSVSVDLFEFGEPVSVEVPEGAGRRVARSCADLALF